MPSADITKRAIADALKRLMTQKGLAKISVGDIVAACGINRNSFYYHFKDKYDLVNWIFYTEIAAELNREEVLNGSNWTLIESIWCFLYESKDFYRNALSVSGQNSFSEYFSELLRTLVLARAEDMFEAEEYRDFYATFFTDAFAAATFRWLSEGAATPPGRLADMMKRAVEAAAAKVLEKDPPPKTQ